MYSMNVEIPFETERHAKIALNSVIQDEEPRAGTHIERKISVERNLLKVSWEAEEARILRTSAQSLLQLLVLVTQTIEQFDGLE
ncbi:Oidioi.mRNA.OKI2018_I69.PAR.g10137.t1.cds [Oikopleura dioica]|uniref:Oidioi.mRNA.OKI2018_I69.PAR.g10137.t1.cds n=1 Tax=Oikopleura dioica TaxID=34765 RepID=A0ABN7RP89_OIKDI|nr:Oidioi.mRNA.OKI2018_I69.PAR.g10137.t1.cds [Oikopleura dioica]